MIATKPKIDYPAEDGEPMAETPIHVEAIILLGQGLEDVFGPSWFVGKDIFWYYREGDPSARIAPDVVVVPDVGQTERRSFFSWVEAKQPVAVFEMASKGTWRNDFEEKFETYESIGLPEYFIFDPTGEFVVPRLQGFRLKDGTYRRIPTIDDDGTIASQTLGLLLRPEGEMLRLIRTESHEPVLTRREQIEEQRRLYMAQLDRTDAEKQRALEEKKRADALAEEVAKLKAELAARATP